MIERNPNILVIKISLNKVHLPVKRLSDLHVFI